ncbi:MAG: hypothetical protein ABI462_11815 [Ignavibacteria bacterium]
MHNYSIDSNERVSILFFIALASIGIMYLIQLLIQEFPWYLEAPSPFLIFTFLFWIFNNYLWKVFIKINIIKTPNLNGNYEGFLKSSYDEFNAKLSVKLTVKQSWTQILITQVTETSKSCSIIASVLMHKKCDPVLIYSYQNDPGITTSTPTMHMHYGTCEHTFDKAKETFNATYYSGRDRNTIGEIFLDRIEEN